MPYNKLQNHLREIADISYASAVLSWDQETYLPTGSSMFRASQLSTLSGISHKLFTSAKTAKLLARCAASNSLNDKQRKNIELISEEYTKQKKYTTAFVQKLSLAVSKSFNTWQQAKKENNFSAFKPHLEKLIDLKKKECELLGYSFHPYNALLDQHEKKATVAELDSLFSDVRQQLVPFVKKIQQVPRVSNEFFTQHFDKQKQWDFSIDALKQMGFDFNRGRQDLSSHPFTTTLSLDDIRVTTRVNENDLSEIIWSTIHEGGHALYEQGLPASEYGMPLSEAVSLGIHESQSRLWENNVGRSLPFWKYNFPLIQKYFPEQLKNITPTNFFHGMNHVQSSFIRTNSDELTYHFHIMIRYEIEKAIFEDKLKVKDLPEYWNTKYKEYLGLDVPNYSKGILQDVHWSHGSFGYFPTYSIGSFYAAQFFNQAKKDISGLETQIEQGVFSNLLHWLRTNIHAHGKFYTAEELSIQITGEKLNFTHFMNYAKNKFGTIYDLN